MNETFRGLLQRFCGRGIIRNFIEQVLTPRADMGVLAEKICGAARAVFADRRRACIIEEHACRRLGIKQNNGRLERLQVAVSTISGGRRTIEVVEILEPGRKDPLLMYGIKKPHGSEPWSAEKASELGIGPEVLDVSESDTILEEFYPRKLNIRNRKPAPDEHRYYAEDLSRFFLAFVRIREGEIICHKDERPEHMFLLGEGKDIRLSLIDWGLTSVRPLHKFREWGSHQLCWIYENLSFDQPSIWKIFVNSLVRRLPEELEHQTLAEAYADFVGDQTWYLAHGLQKKVAVRFLEFSVRCGRLDLDLDWFNEFVDKHRNCGGEDLARAYGQYERHVSGLTQ